MADQEAELDHRNRTLLLDACGVLLGEPTAPLFAAIASSAGKTHDAIATIFRRRFRDDLWSGRQDERTFWSEFATACGLIDSPSCWRRVIDSAMCPMPALHRLAEWSQGARVVLISNHRHEWLLPRLDALGIARHFADLRISSLTGVVKPDPAAYEQALRGAEPRCVLYVDDKPANVIVARELGIQSILADADGLWIKEVDTWLHN
jgi:FMN phosphatase YigB (HAD superfamily)